MREDARPLLRAAARYADPDDLQRFDDALAALPCLGPNTCLAFQVTFALEGGLRIDLNGGGPGHETKAGLTATILRRMKTGAVWRRLYGTAPRPPMPDVPSRLTVQQVAIGYRFYRDDVLRTTARGDGSLDAIIDPKTAASLFDTLFQHGRRGGTIILQRAIDEIVQRLPESSRPVPPVEIDGRMGPRTFGALLDLEQAGGGEALRCAMAHRRTAYQRANGQAVTKDRHDLLR